MRIYTEFLIMCEDNPMPDVDMFWKSWEEEDPDIDGDYYWSENPEKWTYFEMFTKGRNSSLQLFIVRQSPQKAYGWPAIDFLLYSYIDAKNKGEYDTSELIKAIKDPCVTMFQFTTVNLDDYKKFLRIVYEYLKYTKGIMINKDYDAERFYREFILDEGE